MAILGARAAERYDAATARNYFQRAISAARPQERMQLRRMADASIALAERRPDALKEAVEHLGQAPPSNRQLMMLRLMGLLAPPPGAPGGPAARRAAHPAARVALLAIGFGLAKLVALPFGGAGRRRAAARPASSSPFSGCWRSSAADGSAGPATRPAPVLAPDDVRALHARDSRPVGAARALPTR